MHSEIEIDSFLQKQGAFRNFRNRGKYAICIVDLEAKDVPGTDEESLNKVAESRRGGSIQTWCVCVILCILYVLYAYEGECNRRTAIEFELRNEIAQMSKRQTATESVERRRFQFPFDFARFAIDALS